MFYSLSLKLNPCAVEHSFMSCKTGQERQIVVFTGQCHVCHRAAVVPGCESVAGARLSEVGLGRSDVHLACEYQAARSAHPSY